MSEKQKSVETEPVQEKEELVELEIPRTFDPQRDREPVVIMLNFKEYRLARGAKHMVPPDVKRIYDETMKRAEQSMRFVEATENIEY